MEMNKMARTFTEQERIERIRKVGEYFLATNASTREIAKHFCETEFIISNCTVCMYIHLFMKMEPEFSDELNAKIYSNARKTIDDPGVKERVVKVTSLFLSGHNVDQIADETGIDKWTVYRDLIKRLPLLDESLGKDVREMLRSNSRKNIIHGK
jgi:transposase